MQSFRPGEHKRAPPLPISASEPLDRKTPIPNQTTNKSSWPHLVAGASGGVATAIFTSPLDVLRTRLQTDFYYARQPLKQGVILPSSSSAFNAYHHIRETIQILAAIPHTEGWRGLFRGLGPSLTGVVPASAVKFYTYGNCKRLVTEALECDKDAAIVHISAAAAAGIVTGTATNPIWLIKTRLQLDRSRAEGGGGKTGGQISAPRYRNSWDCFQQVVRQEGIRGLYRGLSASYLGAAESTLHLALYEQMKIILARREAKAAGRSGSTEGGKSTDWVGLGSAAGASKLLAGLIAYPHEVVRTRLRQAPTTNGLLKYTGLLQCFRLIWKEEGVVGMYGGLTPHMLRAIPSAMITLSVYEFVLKRLAVEP